MSDKIKQSYIDEFKDIKPSEDFLNRLTQTLEEEQAKKKRSNIKMVRRVASVAACLVVGVLAGVLILNSTKPTQSGDSSSSAVESKPDYTDNIIIENSANIYGDNTAISGQPIKIDEWETESFTAEQYAEAMEKMLSSDSLSYIMVSDTNNFVGADKLGDADIQKLADMFKNATPTDKADSSAERKHYMAVFEDGLIIKLAIVSEDYIEIPSKDVYFSVN